jgi:hypothetical protein
VSAHPLHNPYLDLWHAQRRNIEQRQAEMIRALVNRDHALLRTIKASRALYTHLYSYAIPTEEALLAISEHQPIIEIGAGTGYWSYLLRQLGTDVVCYDSHPPSAGSDNNRFHVRSGCWTDVFEGTETALDTHPDRTLFLCWPPPGDAMACRTLRRYCGEYFIYVGEESLADGVKGSTANDQLVELITDEWTLVKRVSLPNWELCWDALHVFRRKSTGEGECDSAMMSDDAAGPHE